MQQEKYVIKSLNFRLVCLLKAGLAEMLGMKTHPVLKKEALLSVDSKALLVRFRLPIDLEAGLEPTTSGL